MSIYNHSQLTMRPISTVNVSASKKAATNTVSELAPVTKKQGAEKFSMVLSEKQKNTLHDTLGYDQPTPKQRGAIYAYQEVAVQEQREAVMNSMSFHFVV